MGTKNQPGDFDCYEAAAPDEPMFILLARDCNAAWLVEEWARLREERAKWEDDLPAHSLKIAEARACAVSMRDWRSDRAARVGYPIPPKAEREIVKDETPEPYPNFPCSADLIGETTMSDLTMARTVLPLASDRSVDGDAIYQPTPDDNAPRTMVRLDGDVWDDMGRPEQITVTIEPGDLLNVEDADAMDARAVPDPNNFRGSGVAINQPLPEQITAITDYDFEVAACPTPAYHETHRYCPSCPWTERGPGLRMDATDDVEHLRSVLPEVADWFNKEADRLWAKGDRTAAFSHHCQAQGVLVAVRYLPVADGEPSE